MPLVIFLTRLAIGVHFFLSLERRVAINFATMTKKKDDEVGKNFLLFSLRHSKFL